MRLSYTSSELAQYKSNGLYYKSDVLFFEAAECAGSGAVKWREQVIMLNVLQNAWLRGEKPTFKVRRAQLFSVDIICPLNKHLSLKIIICPMALKEVQMNVVLQSFRELYSMELCSPFSSLDSCIDFCPGPTKWAAMFFPYRLRPAIHSARPRDNAMTHKSIVEGTRNELSLSGLGDTCEIRTSDKQRPHFNILYSNVCACVRVCWSD